MRPFLTRSLTLGIIASALLLTACAGMYPLKYELYDKSGQSVSGENSTIRDLDESTNYSETLIIRGKAYRGNWSTTVGDVGIGEAVTSSVTCITGNSSNSVLHHKTMIATADDGSQLSCAVDERLCSREHVGICRDQRGEEFTLKWRPMNKPRMSHGAFGPTWSF